MGLDSVELVMAFEDEFKISIPDEKWVNATTPGKVADLFLAEHKNCQDEKCPSQVAFYRLRRYFVQEMKIPRNSIRIETPLTEIFPLENRRIKWNEFTSNRDLIWQNRPLFYFTLGLSKPLHYFLNILILLSLIQLTLAGLNDFLISIIGLILFVLFTNQYRHVFPNSIMTVKDLISETCIPQNVNLTREEILIRIIKVTSLHLCIPEESIHENSSFRYDLGVD